MAFQLNSGGISSIAGGIGDLFDKSFQYKAQANRLEASSLRKSAGFALESADVSKESSALQSVQQQRKLTQVVGATQAQIASGGFAESGSALDILADSMAQGHLERSVIEREGQIQTRGYEEQARALETQAQTADIAAKAAKSAGGLQNILGPLKIAGGIAAML